MGSHAAQLNYEERWKIIKYVWKLRAEQAPALLPQRILLLLNLPPNRNAPQHVCIHIKNETTRRVFDAGGFGVFAYWL